MNDNQLMHAMSLDDTYRVEQVLARGEDGITELVTIDGAGPFVRKKIRQELARRNVWSALTECSSPRLPRVEATYELPEHFVVVYDFVPGRSLSKVIETDGPLTPEETTSLGIELCEAAEELHRHGIVHRDISPNNIVVAANGAHLIDLGIARMRVEGASKDTTSLGTWGFASPEQYGFAQTDARSDVYSIGRVLGFALTGVRPDDEAYEQILKKNLEMHPRRSPMPSRAPARLSQARDFSLQQRWQGRSPACLDRETTGHLLAQMGRSTMPKWQRVRMRLSATQAKAGRGPLAACC
ncbi:MAG: serine/threonine protein kinase [Collinsella sp.]|nr:serine/threonine protein kinase [Collinsella sp.]